MSKSSTRGLLAAAVLLGTLSVQASAAPACLEQVYAALGRAQGATLSGNGALAHKQLALAGRCNLPGKAYQEVQASLKKLQKQRGVSPTEVQSVLGLLSNAEAVGKGQKPSAWLAFSAALSLSMSTLWTGAHILALLLALGVLWLMWKGFVQGQRFHAQRGRGLWRGLILLLLPTLTQGLLVLLGALGGAAHLQPLQFLGTLAASPALWPLETLLSVLGLGLVAYELYHICVQFGIFGLAKRPTLTPLEGGAPWEVE